MGTCSRSPARTARRKSLVAPQAPTSSCRSLRRLESSYGFSNCSGASRGLTTRRCPAISSLNAELLPHPIESWIASQIVERRLHDVVAKRPVVDRLVEPHERLVEIPKAGVRHGDTVCPDLPAPPP